eukprot:365983-Chlamydomonas_euryale.AAC.18
MLCLHRRHGRQSSKPDARAPHSPRPAPRTQPQETKQPTGSPCLAQRETRQVSPTNLGEQQRLGALKIKKQTDTRGGGGEANAGNLHPLAIGKRAVATNEHRPLRHARTLPRRGRACNSQQDRGRTFGSQTAARPPRRPAHALRPAGCHVCSRTRWMWNAARRWGAADAGGLTHARFRVQSATAGPRGGARPRRRASRDAIAVDGASHMPGCVRRSSCDTGWMTDGRRHQLIPDSHMSAPNA